MTRVERKALFNDGTSVRIRKAERTDAEGIIALMDALTYETENLVYGKGDFKMSVADEIAFMERIDRSDNSAFLLAESDEGLVGFIALVGEAKPKTAHSGTLSMGILRACWGKGIARALLETIIDRARQMRTISKINLLVRDDNHAAIKLYRQSGFQIEGKLVRDFKINGVYYDSYYMGLCID